MQATSRGAREIRARDPQFLPAGEAANLRRARQPEEAAKIYRKMIASGQGGAQPYIALCKILEHQMNDIPSALDTAKRGLIMLSDVPASDPAIQAAFDDLTKRYARLMRKSRPHD